MAGYSHEKFGCTCGTFLVHFYAANIQDLKNIKNVKRCRDGMPKSMHENKGQHIDKAPSLHLFHTAVRQCMGVFHQQ